MIVAARCPTEKAHHVLVPIVVCAVWVTIGLNRAILVLHKTPNAGALGILQVALREPHLLGAADGEQAVDGAGRSYRSGISIRASADCSLYTADGHRADGASTTSADAMVRTVAFGSSNPGNGTCNSDIATTTAKTATDTGSTY